MAYEMKFNFDGAKYNVLASSFAFHRSVDAKGRPSSGVYGGEINLTVESQDDTKIIEIMLNKQTTAQKGDIEYSKGTNSGVFRKVSFEDGFIIAYSEAAHSAGSENMTINITISARVLQIGDAAKLENNWPDHKA
jgi:Hemolysin coregulated protein Hcp (TssD)